MKPATILLVLAATAASLSAQEISERRVAMDLHAAAEPHSADELAKKLSNPVASLISVPFQNNFDSGFGSDDGYRYTLNIQPVIPFSLSEDWNLVSRTILPVIDQDYSVATPAGDIDLGASGLGDVVQSLFFSPAMPTESGLIWGAGPVFLIPTATDDFLGGEKWGIGPTAVLMAQKGPWSYGVLANHIWSVAGEDERNDISNTFLQPFVAHQFSGGRTLSLNTETTYDWVADQWTIPVNLSFSKVTKIGSQMISFSVGAKYYLESPEGGPEWGLRAGITVLFPK